MLILSVGREPRIRELATDKYTHNRGEKLKGQVKFNFSELYRIDPTKLQTNFPKYQQLKHKLVNSLQWLKQGRKKNPVSLAKNKGQR